MRKRDREDERERGLLKDVRELGATDVSETRRGSESRPDSFTRMCSLVQKMLSLDCVLCTCYMFYRMYCLVLSQSRVCYLILFSVFPVECVLSCFLNLDPCLLSMSTSRHLSPSSLQREHVLFHVDLSQSLSLPRSL